MTDEQNEKKGWWFAGGSLPLGAYQPKGANSREEAFKDLSGHGNDLIDEGQEWSTEHGFHYTDPSRIKVLARFREALDEEQIEIVNGMIEKGTLMVADSYEDWEHFCLVHDLES